MVRSGPLVLANLALAAALTGCDAGPGAGDREIERRPGYTVERGDPAAPATDRPTLVLVTLDTLNRSHLGAFGHDAPTSPRIDGILGASILFPDVQAASPWTVPSMASILSGMPFSVHGAGHRRTLEGIEYTSVRPEVPLLAELLGAEGYLTCAMVSNAYFERARGLGFDRGFDYFYTFDGNRERRRPAEVLEELGDLSSVRGVAFDGGGNAEHVAGLFERFVEDGHRRGTFFWIHLFDPHNPYVQRNRYIQAAGHPVPPTPDGTLWMDYPLRNAMKAGKGEVTGPMREQIVHVYDGEVAFLDEQVGRLFDRFQAWAPGDAWFLLSTDHGEELWEHGTVDHDHTMYQELLGSFLALHRRGEPPRVDRRPVRHVDLFATLMGLAGVPAPSFPDELALFAGVDLLGDEPVPSFAVSENNLTYAMKAAVRRGNDKLIRHLQTGRDELYDLASDPGERYPHRDEELAGELGRVLEYLDRVRREGRPVGPGSEELRRKLRSLGYAD